MWCRRIKNTHIGLNSLRLQQYADWELKHEKDIWKIRMVTNHRKVFNAQHIHIIFLSIFLHYNAH